MRPVLRRFLIAAAIIVSILVIGVGWIATAFLFSPCQYTLTLARISPSERYVAEAYGAMCGMSAPRGVVMVRDRSALALRRVDATPPGTLITSDFTPNQRGEDIFWESETTLVIQYAGPTPPELERSEWGGVRVVTRRSEHRP